ncbi:MAG: hypothetical protein E5V89_01890 [Mesorhizobium sp.]|nr:MAG: hypothetical protein E5V89_01890 [Mesorhizobium sp.]
MDGEALACAHKHWLKGTAYHDPFERHKGKNNQHRIYDAVNAIKDTKKVVLTNDRATLDANGVVAAFERECYIAVFEVADVTYTVDDGLRFRLAKRLCNLE